MHNVVMRKIVVSTEYKPLVAGSLVASVTISTPPTNGGSVLFKCADGADVPWVPGEWHELKGVDLAGIQVKGLAGDVVTLVGGTW